MVTKDLYQTPTCHNINFSVTVKSSTRPPDLSTSTVVTFRKEKFSLRPYSRHSFKQSAKRKKVVCLHLSLLTHNRSKPTWCYAYFHVRSQNFEKRLPTSSIGMEQLGSHWTNFTKIDFFKKISPENPSFFTIWWQKRGLHVNTCVHLVEFSLEWEMFLTKVLEQNKTHIKLNNLPPPPKSFRLWHNAGKYGTARQRWQYKTAQAHCNPGN